MQTQIWAKRKRQGELDISDASHVQPARGSQTSTAICLVIKTKDETKDEGVCSQSPLSIRCVLSLGPLIINEG